MSDLRQVVRRIRLALIVAATVCCHAGVFSQSPAAGQPGGGAAGVTLSQVESALLAETNAARSQRGQPPLAADGNLMQGARQQALWMARTRNLKHGQGVAENIGMGQTSADEVVTNWMNSSGHRANILDSGYTRIGVAMARAADGSAYWCQQFR
jgi:uncharacterized protein YkwD